MEPRAYLKKSATANGVPLRVRSAHLGLCNLFSPKIKSQVMVFESFFGVAQKIARKGQYDPMWNNKASAFIFCREGDVRFHQVVATLAACHSC